MSVVVLTKRLAEARQKARQTFPDAAWLPGDECPVGSRVVRSDGHPAVLLGAAVRPDGDATEWWWFLRDDRYPEHVVLDWPPTLRPEIT